MRRPQPLIMLQAECVERALTNDYHEGGQAIEWIGSLIDLWDFVWVNSDEDTAEAAESILGVQSPLGNWSNPYYDGTDPLVWFGTDFSESDHAWCEGKNETVPCLLVEVDPIKGIGRKDIGLATAFIDYLGFDSD